MFIENYTTCVNCSIPNCLDCEDLDTCLVCDEQRHYFLEGDTCVFHPSAFVWIQHIDNTLFRTRTVAITDDNSVMALGFKISKTHFFDRTGDSFSSGQSYTSSVSSGDTYCAEFTSDKEWYITVQLSQGISILKRNSGTGVYEEHQQITLVTSG